MFRRTHPQVDEVEPANHSFRKTAAVVGAVGAVGTGLILHQRRIIKNQTDILQRAAKKDVAKAVKAAMQKTTAVAKTTTGSIPKPPSDPHRSQLLAKLHQNRHNIDFPAPTHPNYSRSVEALVQHVHAPIPEAEKIIASNAPAEAQKRISEIKTARINTKINELRTARTDRLDEGAARDRHERNVVQPHARLMNQAPDDPDLKATAEKLKRMAYSKPHKAVIDPLDPPDLPTRKRGFGRLMKLIELDVNLKETRGPDGKFASGGGGLPDAPSMQYAYHMPMVSPHEQNGNSSRGRGRPPGSLNRRTIQENLASQQIQVDAAMQQPEAKQSHVGRNLLVGAGALAGASLVFGPRIGKLVQARAAEQNAVKQILPKILEGGHLNFAEQAIKHEIPIEDAIKQAHRAGLKSERPIEDVIAAADNFAKENPGSKFSDNPHVFPDKMKQAARDARLQRAANTSVVSAKAGERVAKAQTERAGEELAHNQTKQSLKEAKAALDELRATRGVEAQVVKDKERVIRDLEGKLSSVRAEPTPSQKVTAAMKTVRQVRASEGAVANPEFHNAPGRPGHEKQGELFVSASAARTAANGPTTPLAGTEISQAHIESVKQRIMAGRGDEIRRIAEKGKHSEEDVATAMAHMQIAGSMRRYAPAPKEIPVSGLGTTSRDVEHRAKLVDTIKSNLVAGDRETHERVMAHIKSAGDAAKENYDKLMERAGKTKLTAVDKEARVKHISAAEQAAAHSIANQLVSEGKLHPSVLRGVPHGRKASARELAFARRILHRIELARTTVELLPGMIELSRGDFVRKLLPNFPPPLGGIFKRGGFVQKEAAISLRNLIKRKAAPFALGAL